MHGKRLIGLMMVAAASASVPQVGITGLWSTMDDKTHEPKGVVRIYEDHDQYFGRIISAFNPKDAHEVCTSCPGDMRNKPVIGLVILRDMKASGSDYTGGTIVDPDTGETYRCKLTLEDGGRKLRVRGYIGFAVFGRTQVWTRYTPPPALRETGR